MQPTTSSQYRRYHRTGLYRYGKGGESRNVSTKQWKMHSVMIEPEPICSKISDLGLIEMTRKRVQEDLVSSISQTCPYCNGTGSIRDTQTVVYDI